MRVRGALLNVTGAVVALAAFALTGCLIVPRTVHTPTVVTSEYEHIVPPPRTTMGVELASHAGVINLRVLAPRVCKRETWDVLDVRHHKTTRFEVAVPDEAYAVVFAVVLAPVTLAVSGIISGIIVASSDSTVTRERKKVATSMYECPVFGRDLPVALTLPSGTIIELRTDANGQASFAVPAEEAELGDIGVRVGELPPRSVRYCRANCPTAVQAQAAPLRAPSAPPVDPAARAACLKRRSELMLLAQQVTDIKERTRQLQSLPVCSPQ